MLAIFIFLFLNYVLEISPMGAYDYYNEKKELKDNSKSNLKDDTRAAQQGNRNLRTSIQDVP